jgi:putative membrane protein
VALEPLAAHCPRRHGSRIPRLTALRYQLREPKTWEAIAKPHNAEYKARGFRVEEHDTEVGPALAAYLSPEEHAQVMSAKSKPTQILALQSAHLAELLRAGWIEDFRHMELERVLGELPLQPSRGVATTCPSRR